MEHNTLLGALKQSPWLDRAARLAAWPWLAARERRAGQEAAARHAGAADPRYQWILEQKDRYKGQRCFVVATGPSLTMEDLDRIRGEISFSMNSCLLALDQTAWRPDFYLIQDRHVYRKLAPLLEGEPGARLPTVWVGSSIAERRTLPPRFQSYPLHLLDHRMYHRQGYGTFRFSEDCYGCICDGYSVVFSALQMACYMGFREICLLGCDCSYSGPRSHFRPYGYRDPQADRMGDKLLAGHAAFRQFAEARGVRVLNCTRGGALEVYPRVLLETIV